MEFSKTKKISEFFTEYEAFNSNTANRLGIDNSTNNPVYLGNIKNTAKNLDKIRIAIREPILVNSWFRTKVLNDELKGSKTSQHLIGEAADIELTGRNKNNRDLFDEIMYNHDFDQLILEFPDIFNIPEWVHVSFKRNGNNRKKITVAKKDDFGETKYFHYYSPEEFIKDYPYNQKKVKKQKKTFKLIGLSAFLITLYFIFKN